MSSSATATALDPSTELSKRYMIADIFPLRRIHLLVGPSGGGKTRWMLPMISDWLDGKPIFDRQSFPQKCGYLACDRSADSARETLSTLDLPNLTPQNFPIKSMMDIDDEYHYNAIPKLFPDTRVLFVEALAALIPNGKINDYHSVLKFFKSLNRMCIKHDLTIFGTAHQPKMREDEGFSHPRDKVLGSVAWAACADTVILIEPTNPKDVSSTARHMTVLPRNESHFEYQMDFDDKGRMIIVQSEDTSAEFLLEQELLKHPIGDPLPTATVLEWAGKHKLTSRTAQRWIKNMVTAGKLEMLKKGTYRRPFSN